MMSVVQILLIILLFVIIAGSTVAFLKNQEAERRRKTIGMIKGKIGAEVRVSEKDEQNKRRAEIAKKLKDSKDGDGKAGKKKATLSLQIAQAGLKISVKQYWIYSAISMVVLALFAKIMGQSLPVVLAAAAVGMFFVPWFVLRRMAKRRQKKFLEEFADALEATIRLLKAGMPVSEAIMMISKEYTGPVGEEMSIVYDKQKIGIPLHEAAQEATKRMPLAEMQMFATGLAIQAQTGSSLSEVLQNLANVIRARFKLKRKIKALSSEAIASASIIGALPNLVALGMYFANRDYIMVLFTDSFGQILLIGAVVWMCIGIVMMKVMINFKI
ncbi:MAG: type II secretion system F family protein [Alphaproteobacteria bacterium]|nr:type II secretion system F family protein [Alphaproteobacteria bacterium]